MVAMRSLRITRLQALASRTYANSAGSSLSHSTSPSATVFSLQQSSQSGSQSGQSRHESKDGSFWSTTSVSLLSLAAVTTGLLLHAGANSRRLLNADNATVHQEQNVQGKSWSYEEFKETRTGHYENRIRAYSHPLKVFQYFASIQKNGEFYMTPMDFIISIIPYQPAASNQESQSNKARRRRFRQKCESAIEFFKLADTDGDGLICYEEYIFFLSLLSTPEDYFKIAFRMFDLDVSGLIDLDEFQKIIMQVSKTGVAARQGKRQRGAVAKDLRHGLMENFFGKNGTDQLDFKTFHAFLTRLQDEVLKLEFFGYDIDDNDTISMKDFARSIVSYANHREIEDFSSRIASLPEYPRRISYEEFRQFNKIVMHMDEIKYAITIYSEAEEVDGETFSRADLKRAIKATVGIDLNDDVVDMLFKVFDKNNDGQLDSSEFAAVIGARHLRGLDQPRDLGFGKKLDAVVTCFKVLIN